MRLEKLVKETRLPNKRIFTENDLVKFENENDIRFRLDNTTQHNTTQQVDLSESKGAAVLRKIQDKFKPVKTLQEQSPQQSR